MLPKLQNLSDGLFAFLFRGKMRKNFVFGCVLVFLFSMQNLTPQIIIGLGRVTYQSKALSAVILNSNFRPNFKLLSCWC